MESASNDFAERLEILIKLLRVKSINAFASSIGVGASVVQNFLGKNATNKRSKPSLDTIEKIISRYPRVNLDWLVTGKGEPLLPLIGQYTPEMAKEDAVIQQGNTGNTVGTMAGGSLSYAGTADCLQALEACRGRVKELEGMVADKQLIIDLLQKQK